MDRAAATLPSSLPPCAEEGGGSASGWLRRCSTRGPAAATSLVSWKGRNGVRSGGPACEALPRLPARMWRFSRETLCPFLTAPPLSLHAAMQGSAVMHSQDDSLFYYKRKTHSARPD